MYHLRNRIAITKWVYVFVALLAAVSFGQDKDQGQYVRGLVFVKFKANAITTIAQELAPNDVANNRLREYLSRLNFSRATKVFRDATPADTTTIAHTGEVVKQIDVSKWYTLQINQNIDVLEILDSLRLMPGVESASPVIPYWPFVIPNDTYFYKQLGLKNGSTGRDIHVTGAWDIQKGRNDVIVAVLDGGVDYNHPDLDPGDRSRIIQGYDTGDEDTDPMDDLPGGYAGHGTLVAGIIGAITNNNQGVAGIMWNGKIMPVKVVRQDKWYLGPFDNWVDDVAMPWDIAQGIDYARTHGTHVINMSLGHPAAWLFDNPIYGLSGRQNPVGEAVWNAYNAGVFIVAAAGNDGVDEINYPAGFPGVVAVGASNADDRLSGFSNYGYLNFVAPGQSSANYSTVRYGGYGYFGGTSCASPMSAGAAGLIIAHGLDYGLELTNDDIKHLLEASATKVHPTEYDYDSNGWSHKVGYGRINVEQALQYLEPPYTVMHGSATGGSSQLTWDSHTHTFHGGTGTLPAGVYYGVKQYKVTNSVSFPDPYESAPAVWMRERSTVGWSAANPNRALPWAQIESVTTSGATFSTFVYFIKYDLLGREINEWHPSSAGNVVFAYTVLGAIENLTLVNLSISDTKVYTATNSITAGPNVTVTSTGDVTFRAGSEITLLPGFTAVAGSDFRAYIDTGLGGGSPPRVPTAIAIVAEVEAEVEEIQSPVDPIPTSYALSPAYPNPFNPYATIKYALKEDVRATLKVYDLLGREVATLVNEHQPAAYHSVVWDGRDRSGRPLPSGVYIARLHATPTAGGAGDFVAGIKMVLLK